MFLEYLFQPIIIGLFLSVIFVYFFRRIALKFKILSLPGGRHKQKTAIPLLGGTAVFLSFLFIVFIYPGLVITQAIAGIIVGASLLVILGMLDDLRPLSWKVQLAGQIVASLMVVASGTKLFYINNPFGGSVRLDNFLLNIPLNESVPVLGAIFIIIWLILFANTFNWLDGLDGLAAGAGAISFISLAVLSLSLTVYQPPVAILASVAAGALAGFLIWNFPPAKIYLGGSSAAIGFLLGAISIFAGAKVATLFLVFTVPIIDFFWVIFMRFQAGRSIFSGDASHLHYRLLDQGWSPRKILLLFLVISAVAGVLAISFSGLAKLVALLVFIVGTLIFFIVFDRLITRKKT